MGLQGRLGQGCRSRATGKYLPRGLQPQPEYDSYRGLKQPSVAEFEG